MLFPGNKRFRKITLANALMSSSSLFFGVSVVAAESIQQKEFSHAERATMGSITAFIGSLIFAVYAPVLGLLADLIGPVKALLISQLVLLVPIFIIIRLKGNSNKKGIYNFAFWKYVPYN